MTADCKPYSRNHMLDTKSFGDFIMLEYGLSLVGDMKTDGGFHYLGSTEDKKGRKPFRYCVHLDDPPNIYYNDLKRGFRGTWYPQGHEALDEAGRERRRREFGLRKVRQDAETQDRQAQSAKLARDLWAKAVSASGHHPYLVRKEVDAYRVRQLPKWQKRSYQDIAIPASNANQQIVLPIGNALRGVMLLATVAGEPSNAVINNIQLASGVDVRVNVPGRMLQRANAIDYPPVGILAGSTSWASNSANPTGLYVVDLMANGPRDVSVTNAWDLSKASEAKMILDVTGGATTQITAVTTEFIQ